MRSDSSWSDGADTSELLFLLFPQTRRTERTWRNPGLQLMSHSARWREWLSVYSRLINKNKWVDVYVYKLCPHETNDVSLSPSFISDVFWLTRFGYKQTFNQRDLTMGMKNPFRESSPSESRLRSYPSCSSTRQERKNESWRREGSAPEIMSGRAGRICLYVTWCSTASVILYYSNINMRQQLKKNTVKLHRSIFMFLQTLLK